MITSEFDAGVVSYKFADTERIEYTDRRDDICIEKSQTNTHMIFLYGIEYSEPEKYKYQHYLLFAI